MAKQFITCKAEVKKNAIRRESVGGVEHIVVSSYTLPDDVVMNGVFYPASEIEKSYHTLERTLAPVEHPTDADGNFISASDPDAIANFYAGAYNRNVTRQNGRVHVEKWINVNEAQKSERGQTLLDKINEIEQGKASTPIHTSTGVFLNIEKLQEPQTNAAGQEYMMVASELAFDHDAILLDNEGAATPAQGVGMAVNKADKIIKTITNFFKIPKANQSLYELRESLAKALESGAVGVDQVEDLTDQDVVFWSGDELYTVPYVVDEQGIVTITGLPLPVEKTVLYTPKTNHKEGDTMKDLILNALTEKGIKTEGLSDADLLKAYNEIQEPTEEPNQDSSAVDALIAKVAELEAKLEGNAAKELDADLDLVLNSGKYEGFTKEDLQALGAKRVAELAANCRESHALSGVMSKPDDGFTINHEMPA